ncbi:MAG: activator of alkane oxidation [Caulobacteraceae bacterium]|nr:activator of alkane oxidation [Caulobacteraceae bacterium]
MKTLATLSATALLALGLASQAFAAPTLGPVSTSFTGMGTTSMTKSGITIGCNANFTGSINSTGAGQISTAAFTAGNFLCPLITATNLPWPAAAVTAGGGGAGTANILTVAVSTPLGNCGPSTLPTSINTTGVISFSGVPLSGGCTVSGSIQSTPHVFVVP